MTNLILPIIHNSISVSLRCESYFGFQWALAGMELPPDDDEGPSIKMVPHMMPLTHHRITPNEVATPAKKPLRLPSVQQ